MATIGLDCEIILDGTGYFVLPASFQLRQPRIRKTTVRADGAESYVDLGPGKRSWSMVILCFNELTCYDGSLTGISGQQYRDALRTSYLGSAGSTIVLKDPLNGSSNVHFDAYSERVNDLHTQITSLMTGGSLAASYEVSIELVEA